MNRWDAFTEVEKNSLLTAIYEEIDNLHRDSEKWKPYRPERVQENDEAVGILEALKAELESLLA